MIFNRTGEMTWRLTAESIWERHLLDLMECSHALQGRLYERKEYDKLTMYCEDGGYIEALLEKFASELMEEADNFNKLFKTYYDGDDYEV